MECNPIKLDKEEYWGYWWKCDKCGDIYIIKKSNYCMNCGAKINWDNEIK